MNILRYRNIFVGALATLGVMVYFMILFAILGEHNFRYIEHTTTMYYDGENVLQSLNRPGGVCQILSDMLIQLFVFPWVGAVLTSLLLTVISVLTARLLRVIYGNNLLVPLALLPATMLAILQYNANYLYAGTLSFLFMLIALNIFFRGDGRIRYSTIRYRVLYTLCATVLLYAAAGAVSLLYGMSIVVIMVFKTPRQSAYYLMSPLLVVILSYVSVRSGYVGDQLHALLPAAYYVHRLGAPGIVNQPWITFGIVVVVACFFSLYRLHSLWLRRSLQGISILAVIVTASVMTRGVNTDNECFKRLNCYLNDGDWEGVLQEFDHDNSIDNLLLSNCYNLAAAETMTLGDRLFEQHCVDIRNIYITGDSNPLVYMLLSDIYFSMGHLALAQRHAFEANESFGNKSPRMLKRLVDTNIAYGDYQVAEKYISKLEKTLYYKDWAAQRRTLLNDEAVNDDPYMRTLRACIFEDNRFSGFKGLDDDLKEVLRANPEHKITAQYVGALYLLTKDLPRFGEFVDESLQAGILEKPLPRAFQEGIIQMGATSENSDSVYAHYGIESRNIDRYKAFKAAPSATRDNFWHFYYYQR